MELPIRCMTLNCENIGNRFSLVIGKFYCYLCDEHFEEYKHTIKDDYLFEEQNKPYPDIYSYPE